MTARRLSWPASPRSLWQPARPAQDTRFLLPNIPVEAYTLPNGLKVVLHRDPSVPRVTVCMAYHVGSKNESAGRTGFAHFFEHMMFRGTKNVPNYDIPLQETGAQSNAFTTEDMTVYFETVPSLTSTVPFTSKPNASRSCPPRWSRRSSTPSARSSRTSAASRSTTSPMAWPRKPSSATSSPPAILTRGRSSGR